MKYTLREYEKLLVDTNLLVYLADKKDFEKHNKAILFFEEINDQKLFLSAQSIREFADNCLTKKIIDAKTIIEFIESFVSKFVIIQDDFFDTKSAIELCGGNQNLFWDASIVSVMKRNYVETIITENTKDFTKLGVKTINPFK